jgi:hypothetical protein
MVSGTEDFEAENEGPTKAGRFKVRISTPHDHI